MSIVIETTLGDITVDLFLNERPTACLNFLNLCKMKYYNYNLFHTISRGFIAQTGDPTGSRTGGESIFGVLDGPSKRYFEGENEPRIKHTKMGLISFVGNEERMIGSQFFFTLGEDLTYLDGKHCVFGEVVEGFETLEIINEVICDKDDRPYQDVRITHTVILDDPYPNPKRLLIPSRSPSPSAERLQGGRIAPDEEIDELEGKTTYEMVEMQAEREAKARATILEMVGDLPDADMAPPENVLFVCKLNPVTNDDDLEIIFSRFGKIKSCEVIRDKKSGDSLQYAFVEFETQKSCEDAYFKMDNVLIDDRRIHVDFSQSVSKVKWHGKGRGVTHYDENGSKSRTSNDIGIGNYKRKNDNNYKRNKRSPNRSQTSGNKRDISKNLEHMPSNNSNTRISKYDRGNSLSPKRKRNFISPKRYETSQRYSRKSRDRSISPKREKSSPSPRKYREYSSSSRRESNESKSYQRNRQRYGEQSESLSRSHESRNKKYDNEIKYSKITRKEYFTEKRHSYSPQRKASVNTYKDNIKSNMSRTFHSDSENESGKKSKNKKKRTKYSSEDSNSDDNKKVKGSNSDSSNNDYETKNKKKNVKKDKCKSDTDRYKSKKSKKKKKKYSSDSD